MEHFEKIDKIYFFINIPNFLTMLCKKENEKLEFVQEENFEFIHSLKNNGTKLIFDDFCEAICNSKAFVDIATAGRHRGLSKIYI